MALEKDIQFFRSKLPEYLQTHKGQYVLIKDEAVHGFFPNYEEALKEAVGKFGNSEVLIQEITNENRVNYLASWLLAADG